MATTTIKKLYNGQWIPIEQYYPKLSADYKNTIDKVTGEYKTAYGTAKAANEGRYGNILAGYDKMNADTEGILGQYGQAATQQIQDQSRIALNATTAGLARSGMANSTLAGSYNKALSTQTGKSLAGVAEDVAMKKLGYKTDIAGKKLATMENRTDAYPDAGAYQMALSSIYESATKSGVPVNDLLKYMTLGL